MNQKSFIRFYIDSYGLLVYCSLMHTEKASPERLDPKLARGLALAVAKNPAATLQQLAEAAGISKATLYRKVKTRELLMDALLHEAVGLLQATLDAAELEAGDPVAVLRRISKGLLAEREMQSFLACDAVRGSAGLHREAADKEWLDFLARMEALFRRGQAEGVFRIDVTPAWLAQAYGYMVDAALEAELGGRLAQAETLRSIEALFLHGALRQ